MFSKLFRKPRWQDRDATVRAPAVASDTDPKLLAALPEIARNDEAATVRLAALKRLDEQALWDQALQDTDPQIRIEAKQRLQSLLKNCEDEQQALTWLQQYQQADWLEALTDAKLHRVRLAAARKSGKIQHWLSVLIQASEAQLGSLMEEINDTVLLQALVERMPKKHKRVHTLLHEKLDQRMLEQGDTATVAQHASKLCKAYVELCNTTNPEQLKQVLEQLDQQWSSLPAQTIPEVLAKQQQGARSTVIHILQAHDPEHQAKLRQQAEQQAKDLEARMQTLLNNESFSLTEKQSRATKLQAEWKTLPHDLLDSEYQSRWQDWLERLEQLATEETSKSVPQAVLNLQEQIRRLAECDVDELDSQKLTRLEEQLTRTEAEYGQTDPNTQTVLNRSKQTLHRQVERLQLRLQELNQLQQHFEQYLAEIKTALETGKIQKAAQVNQAISPLVRPLETHGKLPEAQKHELIRLQTELKEKRQWLHWSNEEHRKKLCDELQQFAERKEHPDAVREKLRLARQQWQEWEQSEHPLDGQRRFAASTAIWKHYARIRRQLEKQTQPYFERRQELQQEKLQHCQQAITRMQGLLNEPIEQDGQARQLEQQRKQLVHCIQRLDELPAGDRKETARSLRNLLDASRKKLDMVYEQWQEARQTLIQQAARAEQLDNLHEAMEQAKKLQQRWKALPHLPRNREQKLWRAFRQHCDAIFQRRDAEQAEEQQQLQALRQQAEQLVEQISRLEFDQCQEGENLRKLENRLKEVREAWKNLEHVPEEVQQRFDNTLKQVLQQQNRARRSVEQNRWLKQIQAVQQAGNTLPEHCPNAWKEATDHAQSADEDTLHRLVLEAEILADLPSPEHDQELRMQHQIELMQKKHQGELGQEEQPVDSLLINWLKQGGQQLGSSHALQQRFFRALEQMIRNRE